MSGSKGSKKLNLPHGSGLPLILLKIFLAGIGALIGWEIILENCIIRMPGGNNSPVLGWVMKSGTYLQGSEGFCRTWINSLGMRGGEVSPKQPGEYRILSLGDSYTSAFQVSDEKTYTQQLQLILTEKSGKNIKTINGGREGASPAYYIHLADFYNSVISPDLVVIEINEQDYTVDIFDGKTREFYVKKEGSCFRTVTNFQDYYIWKNFPWLKPFKSFLAFSTLRLAAEKVRIRLDEHRGGKKPQSNRVFEKTDYSEVIDWTVRAMKQAYPDIIILYIAFEDSQSDIEISLKHSANKSDVDFIDTREIFSEHRKSSCQPVNGFYNTEPGTGHLNETGNSIIANALADYSLKRVSR